jgi:hypothetical protein
MQQDIEESIENPTCVVFIFFIYFDTLIDEHPGEPVMLYLT